MKQRIVAGFLCLLMLCGLAACGNAPSETGEPDAAAQAKAWMSSALKNDTLISFEYDGKAFAEHIKGWEKSVEDTEEGHTLTYKKDGLTVRTDILYKAAHNAYEWVSYYINEGSEKTPILSNILALDSTVVLSSPIFTSAQGTSNSSNDFQPFSVDLSVEPEVEYKTYDGTPSTQGQPYFDLSNGSHGVIGAIGWTGNWRLKVANDNGQVHLQAGMAETHLSVYPEEKLRTPMIVLQFFEGDRDAGHNVWRDMVYAEYTPIDKNTGKPYTELPKTYNVWGGMLEENMLSKIESADGVWDYEVFWIDAGWYGDRLNPGNDNSWMQELGNWYINEKSLPNGFEKVDAALEERGKDLMLWMMHEAVKPDSLLAQEHPEYLLPYSSVTDTYLVDYSQEEVLQYMLDLVGGILEQAGAEWLRVDFTGSIGEMWSKKDEGLGKDRVGITEIYYVTNLYRFYDELKERIPGLMIDNCASGGRRMDLETVRRTLCFWRSDMQASITKKGNADATRHQAANAFYWLPLTTSGWSNDGSTTTYAFRSIFASGYSCYGTVDPTWYAQMTEQFEITQEMMYKGDYYILASGVDESYDTVLSVYEFFIPEEQRGMLMAFRPANCAKDSGVFVLKGLDPEAEYELELVDNGQKLTLSGEKLMTTGLALSFPSENLSLIIYVNKV